jgi:thiol-disulfide isomerase/thioredoxin
MKKNIILIFCIVIFFITTSYVGAINIESDLINKNLIKSNENIKLDDVYNGKLKVYIVEPKSRWDNYNRDPYHYGFLDYAFDDFINISYLGTYNNKIIWNGTEAGYNNIKEDNLIVIAAIFNSEINEGFAYPPTRNKFDAYYVDAAAGAKPGEIGYNTINSEFTHTVFVEEGTATWCPYCPLMAEALDSIYESGDYPFYFVALVSDKNINAGNRLIFEYNIYGYPTSFFDGGYQVLVGGYEEESYYRNKIELSGIRDVHDLNLSVSVDWLSDGEIEIDINIVNDLEIQNDPPEIPTIIGESSGRNGKTYDYKISTIDPNGDNVYYWILWYDGCPGVSWDGPYNSGEEIIKSFSWENQGNYTISVKAKDENGAESDWATLEIKMPKKIDNNMEIITKFLNNYLKLFGIFK